MAAAAVAQATPTATTQFWEVDNQAILLTLAQAGQHKGAAVAVGDFDGDGIMDLAVGIPEKDHTTIIDTGGVLVLYGALFADGLGGGSAVAWSGVAP